MKPWEQYGVQVETESQKPWEMYGAMEANSPDNYTPKESIGRTAFDQGMQGATFGFADEVSDRLGAAGATVYSNIGQMFSDNMPNIDYANALKEARQLTQERQKRQWEQNPGTALAANIAGGLLTGGAGATTKAGTAIGNSLRAGNLGARTVKGAAAGAASGGLYGLGAGEDGERLGSAGEGALLGAAGGAAVPAVMAGLQRANTRTIVPSSEKIRQAASRLYQAADQKGGILKPEFTNSFINKAKKSLLSDDALINAMKSNKPLANAFDDIGMFQNQPMTLQRAQAFDEQLGNMVDGFVENGKLTKVGKKLFEVQSQFREMVENAGEEFIEGGRAGFEALKEGRRLWAVSRRLDDIERIIKNAENYQVPATAIKTGFRTLLRNGNRLRGYTPQEVKAIEKAAKTGIVTDILNVAGSRLAPLISAGGGWAAGGPVGGVAAGLASHLGSTVARGAATALQKGRANDVARIVAERSGMVKEVPRIDWRQIMKLPPAKARATINALHAQEKSK